MKKKAIIFGAGVSGLSIGYNLLKNNVDVEIYEETGTLGGIARSESRNGYLFDSGPHGFHSRDPKIVDFFKEIMGDNYTGFEKYTEIKYKGQYVTFPLKPMNILLTLSIGESFRCISSLIYSKIKSRIIKSEDKNAEEWLISRYGEPLYRVFFLGYTAKIWGIKPKELSAKFAQHRIPVISFTDLILRGTLGFKKWFGRQHKYAETAVTLYYPKHGGIGAFSEEMARKIKKMGGKINLNSRVASVNVKDGKVGSVDVLSSGKTSNVKGDFYISTIPIIVLPRIVRPILGKDVLEAASKIKFRSLLVFCLLIKKDQVFKPLHYYYYDKYFGRLTELKNWSRELYPKGITGLITEKTCDFNDELWNADENELFRKVIDDIKSEGFIEDKDILDKFVIRKKFAYPVYLIGFEENVEKIENALGKFKNLFMSGRQARFRYMDMDNCVEEGLEVVNEIVRR
ncbi:FAD-dependent oxidoreductase [Candidatus Woesearchaeota archaeon]|nr:FAD-dependent oxidoreductase [Candidatus Woesearchaeota archaeon]